MKDILIPINIKVKEIISQYQIDDVTEIYEPSRHRIRNARVNLTLEG